MKRYLSAFTRTIFLPLIPLFLVVVLMPVQKTLAATGTTYFRVAATGSDNPACGTNGAPCRTIQYAVNLAQSDDVITVASGTYTYDGASDPCSFLTTRAVACFVDKHLTILGGYTTANWDLADSARNVAVIDGQNAHRGLAIIAYNGAASVRMEGFTVQNGLAQGTAGGSDFYTYAFGGGLWAQNSSVNLKNVIFKNNRALGGNTGQSYGGGGSGGGLAIQSSKYNLPSSLENLVFEGNQAIGGNGNDRGGVALGGGLFAFDSTVNGNNLSFINNQAQAGHSLGSGFANGLQADALGGGSAFQNNSHISLSKVTAIGNSCQGGNAGSFSGATGGGAFGGFLNVENSTISITNSSITDNWARGGNASAGGVAMGGGFMANSSNADLRRLQVIKNAAISGASTFGGNAGSPSGGGGHVTHFNPVTEPTVRIENSIFADNRVEVGSPGRYIGGGGGGLLVQALSVDIVHSTFAHNYLLGELTIGQAILVLGLYGTSGTPGTANIQYTIISDHVHTSNSSALTVMQGSTANINSGMFAGNSNDTNKNGQPCPPGVIAGLSTMLTVPTIGYVSPGPPDYDYHLRPSSSAIDKVPGYLANGTLVDIDGQPRPYGNAVDIGADEYVPPAFIVSPTSLTLLASDNGSQERYVNTAIANGPEINWTASTTAPWLFLGSVGNAKQVSGHSGEDLEVRFAPGSVGLGIYESSILISSPDVPSVTVTARLVKVDRLYRTLLPLVLRNAAN